MFTQQGNWNTLAYWEFAGNRFCLRALVDDKDPTRCVQESVGVVYSYLQGEWRPVSTDNEYHTAFYALAASILQKTTTIERHEET